MKIFNLSKVFLIGVIFCAEFSANSENWSGYQGGGPRRNASSVDIVPDKLSVSWMRRFDRQVVIGSNLNSQPLIENRIKWGSLNGAFGSRNLVLMDGKIAIIAADHKQIIPEKNWDSAWMSILDASTGKTLNCISVSVTGGKAGLWGWPRVPWTDANDLLTGQVVLNWDKQRNACFLSVGGDGARYTAYLPTENQDTYISGQYQPGVPAFKDIFEKNFQIQDAFGRPRSSLVSIYAPDKQTKSLPDDTAHWGPSLVPKDYNGRHSSIDKDLPILLPHPGLAFTGIYQNNHNNRTAFIAMDNESPLIAMGQAWHADTCSYYFANKWNGLYAMPDQLPVLQLTDEDGKKAIYSHARPYSKWGGFIVHKDKIFGMSPGTDDDKNGQLGLIGGTGYTNPPWKQDQGIGLWAYDLQWEDKYPNDGAKGPAAIESAKSKLAWGWSRKSTGKTINESHWEIDGLYRNKAMLVDSNDTLWAIWTRSMAEGIELVKAQNDGQKGWMLGIGKDRPGSEVWPHLALAEKDKKRWIVAYTGNSWHRNKGSFTLEYSNCALPAGAKTDMAWLEKDETPLGPAELAVFDTVNEKITNRIDFSKITDDLPPNEFYGYTDRSQLVVAGHWAYVGWVSTKITGNAELVLCVVDLEKENSKPQILRFPLKFSAEKNPASALIDLIACDGRINALIYRSDVLNYGDERWYEQILVSLDSEKRNIEK